MDSIDRVTATDYKPSTDDILRSRLQTMGIASHEFMMQVSGKSVLWHLYDVGGARGQRHKWVPYFDDANAIIFLAPVSAFDQVRNDFRRAHIQFPELFLCFGVFLISHPSDCHANLISF